jgi:hypothetical protein
MLSGDDLSTQYFIAGTALTILGIAVTQAGWNHPWFVRAMFLAGVVMSACALLWKPIISTFPRISEITNPVGSSSQSWFALLVAALLFVFFLNYRSQREWMRKYPTLLEKLGQLEIEKSAAPEVDGSWFSSRNILLLAHVSIRERWSETKQKMDAAEAKAQQLEQERSILSAKFGPLAAFQTNPDPEYADLSVRATAASQAMYAEGRKLDAIRRELLDDVYSRLWSGLLISKGFTPPVESNHDEVPIPAAQWRLLRFDKDMNEAEGGGIKYIGIAVGRPKRFG